MGLLPSGVPVPWLLHRRYKAEIQWSGDRVVDKLMGQLGRDSLYAELRATACRTNIEPQVGRGRTFSLDWVFSLPPCWLHGMCEPDGSGQAGRQAGRQVRGCRPCLWLAAQAPD